MSWESLCELTTYLKIHITRILSATPTCMPLRLSCGIGPLLPPWAVAGLRTWVPQFCGVTHQTEQTLGRVTCHASEGKWTSLEPSKTLTKNGYGDKPQQHLFLHSLCTSLSPLAYVTKLRVHIDCLAHVSKQHRHSFSCLQPVRQTLLFSTCFENTSLDNCHHPAKLI